MSKVIVYTQEDGSLAVIVPAKKTNLTVEEVAKKDVPKDAPYRIVDTAQLPPDRLFRDAWSLDEEGVAEDLTKAKKISHDRRRKKREADFAVWDEIIMKQIPGENLVEAENQRQKIREKNAKIQSEIDAAKTLEELRNLSFYSQG